MHNMIVKGLDVQTMSPNRFLWILMSIMCFFVGLNDSPDGCLFDGRTYKTDDVITIPNCLGEMTCLGNYNLSPIREATHNGCRKTREVDGQSGCLFDGRVYGNGDVITIAKCLGEMTCLGHNNYSQLRPASPDCQQTRDVDGQSGCLFDGRVYGPGDVITIGKCLAQMTCLGHNNYGNLLQLGGVCPDMN